MDIDLLAKTIELVIDALTGGTSAAVAAGLIAVPLSVVIRDAGNRWKWFKQKVKGVWMIAVVMSVSTLVVFIWSIMPGVEMTFSISAVIAATGSAVLTNEATKKKKGGK